jgi:hypothetical protein
VGFRVLRFISLDTGLLSNDSGGTNASDVGEMTATGLTDFLPPSIETLYFTHCEHLEEM